MKKILILIVVLSLGYYAQGQINSHALGLRLGGNGDINGAEFSYQRGLGYLNRMELDLGFGGNKNHSRLSLTGIYQWHWNINEGLNWYAGPGGSVGLYSDDGNDGFLNIAVGGQIGIEYNFIEQGFPILVSLDARPMWDLLGDNPGLGWGIALGIRYVWEN